MLMTPRPDSIQPLGMGPATGRGWEAAIQDLHSALRRWGYMAIARLPTTSNPLAALLELENMRAFVSGKKRLLMEPSAVPGFYRAVERLRAPRLERQLVFFFLGESLSEAEVEEMLRGLPGAPNRADLLEAGVIEADPAVVGALRSRQRFVPVDEFLIVADRNDRSLPGFTYVGRDSLVLAEMLRAELAGKRFARGLDLCTGSGVQALILAESADDVRATDLNPRAVAYANLNAELCGLSHRVRAQVADLASGIEGPFDVVVANPPYVWMPEESRAENLDGFGGKLGLEVVRRILVDLDRLLSERGVAHMVCEAPVIGGVSALESVAKEAIRPTRLRVTLHPLWYSVHRRLAGFHKQNGASHVVYYHVEAVRADAPELIAERLPPLKHALYSAYVKLAGVAFS